jgi:hypothetical protein
MDRHVTPNDLARLIATLLVAPKTMGELDSPRQHAALCADLAGVVALHCGGEVRPAPPTTPDRVAPASVVCVRPDASLPDLIDNAWSVAALDAADGYVHGADEGTTAAQAFAARCRAWDASQAALHQLVAMPGPGACIEERAGTADDAWEEDADLPLADWQYEAANDNTRCGYREWVAAQRAADLVTG